MLKRKKEKFNLRKQKGWLAGSSATQTICVSFLLVIAAGTLLLSLPIASKQGRLGLVDALFTAPASSCGIPGRSSRFSGRQCCSSSSRWAALALSR